MKILSVLFLFFGIFTSKNSTYHPYHISTTEINYNQKSKNFEVTVKIFTDDLEAGLNKKYSEKIRFSDPKFNSKINEVLAKYCNENLKLKNNSKAIALNYLGFEEEKESVLIYLESNATQTPKKVEAQVSFLYHLYNDQINLVHLTVAGKRKSCKLMYPVINLTQNF